MKTCCCVLMSSYILRLFDAMTKQRLLMLHVAYFGTVNMSTVTVGRVPCTVSSLRFLFLSYKIPLVLHI